MSTALVPSAPAPPARPVTGDPSRWRRDFALMGALTGVLATAVLGLVSPTLPLLAGIIGLLLGALLGEASPRVLERVRGRVPLATIGLLTLPVGAGVGALVGGLAALLWSWHPGLALIVGGTAGLCGALQLGAFWLPYTVLAVLRRPTWPVVVASAMAAPLLGWISALVTVLVMMAL